MSRHDQYEKGLKQLMEEHSVTTHCANDVLYLRQQSGWSQDGEDRLIQAHRDGEIPDVRMYLSQTQS